MIHMYHEIAQPYEFLWHLRGDLKRDGRVVVVDADRTTDRHGTPPRLLVCEFNAVGYELTRFERLADSESYFASFEPRGPRPEPRRTSGPARSRAQSRPRRRKLSHWPPAKIR